MKRLILFVALVFPAVSAWSSEFASVVNQYEAMEDAATMKKLQMNRERVLQLRAQYEAYKRDFEKTRALRKQPGVDVAPMWLSQMNAQADTNRSAVMAGQTRSFLSAMQTGSFSGLGANLFQGKVDDFSRSFALTQAQGFASTACSERGDIMGSVGDIIKNVISGVAVGNTNVTGMVTNQVQSKIFNVLGNVQCNNGKAAVPPIVVRKWDGRPPDLSGKTVTEAMSDPNWSIQRQAWIAAAVDESSPNDHAAWEQIRRNGNTPPAASWATPTRLFEVGRVKSVNQAKVQAVGAADSAESLVETQRRALNADDGTSPEAVRTANSDAAQIRRLITVAYQEIELSQELLRSQSADLRLSTVRVLSGK